VLLITSKYKNFANVMPIAWSMPLNMDPPIIAVCIGDHSYTFEIVKKTNEFVINIPSTQMLDLVYKTGNCSGKNTDKFKKFKIETLPSKLVKAPSIKGALAVLECKVINKKLVESYNLFIAKIVNASVEKKALTNKIFYSQNKKYKPIMHLGSNIFTATGTLLKA